METRRIVVPAAEEILGLYFPVLDYGFCSLLDYMGGDIAIERAARCSYTIGHELRDISKTRSLIRYLFRHRHSSPFEQVEIQCHIGMPIFVMRQFVRHRTSQLNEYSGRYSVMPMLFYRPDQNQVCYQSTDNKQGRSGPVSESIYDDFVYNMNNDRNHIQYSYEWALKQNIARETARIDLPLRTYTFIYWKIDLRNLFHLIGLRSDPHAQWEIRQYSDILAGIAQRVCPLAFEAFQDYQLGSVTFCQGELAALRAMANYHVSPITWDSPPPILKEAINEILNDYGIVKREAEEFWAKLRIKTRRDFSLNLSEAKSADYFLKIVEDHAIEVEATA